MITLFLSFLITALLYAAVGFGGGSTYNALLVLAQTDYRILPAIALLCNVIVVIGGTYRFYRAGYVDMKRILPWLVTSVPAAWVGGMINISQTVFVGLLGGCLLVAGARMFFPAPTTIRSNISHHSCLPLPFGAVLGVLAGLVGIGGGIFLAPLLYLLRWDNAKNIAATCSVFILVNSLAGLAGHMMRINKVQLGAIMEYWYVFPAVLIGGQMGSLLGTKHLNQNVIKAMTGFLILYVAMRLLWRWQGIVFHS